MDQSMETWAENLQQTMGEFAEKSRSLQERVANAEATVSDPAERVSVTVDQHGKLKKLEIKEVVMGRMTAAELSATILNLATEGSMTLQYRIAEEFHRIWGTDLSPADLTEGRVAFQDAIRQLRQANFGSTSS